MKSAPPRAGRKVSASKPTKSAKKSAPAAAAASSPPAGPSDSELNDDDASSSEDEEFVSEDTMARLMEALGEDGVKDALAELSSALNPEDDDDEEEDDNDFEGGEGEQSEEDVGEISLAELADLSAAEESDEEEDEDDMDLEEGEDVALDELDDEEEEVDEDVVPHQKVTIFNKVRSLLACFLFSYSDFCGRKTLIDSLPLLLRSFQHALTTLRQRIHAPYVGLAWSETMAISAPADKNPMHEVDPTDDLSREVALFVFPPSPSFSISRNPFADLFPPWLYHGLRSRTATSKPWKQSPSHVNSPRPNPSPSPVRPTSTPRWSNPTTTWNASANDS